MAPSQHGSSGEKTQEFNLKQGKVSSMPAPWPRKAMVLNLALALPSVLLGGYILWQTTQVFFWLYLAALVGILTVGRYFVCRACPYYGQDCPTYGWGHLARLMFPRDETKGFNSRAVAIDFAAIILTALLPIIAWAIGFSGKVADFGRTEDILTGVYLVLVMAAFVVHQETGCSKCELEDCPFSKAAQERKKQSVRSV
jgi:fatty acid desaturase